ncbi:MAG: hypothetical protein MUC29_06255 [Pyrinomonadaceae bacterium]|nr:hypothetical protein [Pyrinomonadaceae bacterium]
MSLLEQQNFLAKLFTDTDLRENFWLNPNEIGLANNLNETEVTEIAKINEQDFNYFAESLYFKRLSEVENILPLTVLAFGKTNFRETFKEFANQFLPKSIKKHLEDSVEFCDFLQKKELEKVWQKDVVKYEQAKLLFYGYGKLVVFRVLHYDFTTANGDIRNEPFKRLSLAVWLRFGKKGKIYHRIF